MNEFPQGLASVDKELFDRVWAVVQECGEEERHFNQLQSVYRGLASTWFLATVGAVGYLLFNKDFLQDKKAIATAHAPYAALVCLLGLVGFVLLWVLDLLVYHQLLRSAFYEGFALEAEFPWLPRIRTNMHEVGRNSEGDADAIFERLLWFYVSGTGLVALALALSSGWAIRVILKSIGVCATNGCAIFWGWVVGVVVAGLSTLGIWILTRKTLAEPQSIRGITIHPGVVIFAPGKDEKLRAFVTFSDGLRKEVTEKVTWYNSDKNVAVDGGRLKAQGSGAARIMAKVQVLKSITVNKDVSVFKVNGSYQLTATGQFSEGPEATLTDDAKWESLDENIVKVSDKGRITVNKAGTAKIVASFGGIRGELDITV